MERHQVPTLKMWVRFPPGVSAKNWEDTGSSTFRGVFVVSKAPPLAQGNAPECTLSGQQTGNRFLAP